MTRTIDVRLGERSYAILIEDGALARLGPLVAGVAPHGRALLAVDARLAASYGATARSSLEGSGYEVVVHEITAEERAKTLATVRELYDTMMTGRLERGSPVVALGGGIVGDVAGFAAATWLRGVPLVQVPTTLLAMVDAAIGGKTGVNLERRDRGEAAKNLVGAFWQPRAVVADPEVLATLDPRDLRCGLAESVKHAIIADAGLFASIETEAARLLALDRNALLDLIARSAAIKVRVVEADEREAGARMRLNLGHTFAHAVEPVAALDLRHGEAVAIGLCAAAHCAVETDRLAGADAARIEALLAALGLPTRLPRPEDAARLVETMGYDKKVADGAIRLVLPVALGRAEVVADVPAAAIVSAWRAVGAAAPGGT